MAKCIMSTFISMQPAVVSRCWDSKLYKAKNVPLVYDTLGSPVGKSSFFFPVTALVWELMSLPGLSFLFLSDSFLFCAGECIRYLCMCVDTHTCGVCVHVCEWVHIAAVCMCACGCEWVHIAAVCVCACVRVGGYTYLRCACIRVCMWRLQEAVWCLALLVSIFCLIPLRQSPTESW